MAAAASPDALLHLAALHTLAQTGFASTSRAASLTLSTVLARYLRIVAQTCTEHAALAGRSKVVGLDIVEALEELGVGGVGELMEFAGGLEKEVYFQGGGLDSLEEYLQDGLSVADAVAELRLVYEDDIKAEVGSGDDEGADAEDEEDGEEGMDVDVDVKAEDQSAVPFVLRHTSPDLSWLPPLPGHSPPALQPISSSPLKPSSDPSLPPAPDLDALPSLQSLPDRYLNRTPYASSQLAVAHPWTPPPTHLLPASPLPPATSSFPSLLTAFEATRGEPSSAFRQASTRPQATELLRRTIAPPEQFSPLPTLSTPALAAPRLTPIVPSSFDSASSHLLPLNPDPLSGLLSPLVHRIQSPHFPPTLRERLTSIRAPQPQADASRTPIFYGEPVRGPGPAATARAKGKPVGEEEEGWLRYAWDSGPKGSARWGSGRLPQGKKVVQSGEGEAKPRVPPGTTTTTTTTVTEVNGIGEGARLLKLRLPGEFQASVGAVANGEKDPVLPATPSLRLKVPALGSAGEGATSPGTGVATTPTANGTTGTRSPTPMPSIKIKLGGVVKREPSDSSINGANGSA